MKAFTSQYIFDGKKLNTDQVILTDNNIIIDILPRKKLASSAKFIDYGKGIITPGFIDLQVNGCGGVLFNDNPSLKTLETIHQTWLKFGTTSFLPTLISCEFSKIQQALETIKQWFVQYGNTRGVLGIHLEGPFIAPNKAGIHDKTAISKPKMNLLKQIVTYRKFFPIKITIASEEFTTSQIKFLLENKIILSLGHSNASYTDALKAINLGITTSTHMFNAMSGLAARNPGVIGAILNSKNLYTGVIADLKHVAASNIELLHKLKPNKTYLVTDSVTPSGTNMTKFTLLGKKLHIINGCCIDDNGILGGTYLTMNQAVENCVKYCNIDLAKALNMASYIPAKVMGLNKVLGKIKPGYKANLIHLNLKNFSCNILN